MMGLTGDGSTVLMGGLVLGRWMMHEKDVCDVIVIGIGG
jgi:hypothetical protein